MSVSAGSGRVDGLIEQAVFGDEQAREENRRRIREMAAGQGIYPASIQGLYDAAGAGVYSSKTVPAINIRGLTYEVARSVFRAALRHEVGAFIFEIARSEIGYTKQRPAEYVACILAAAVKEAFQGPVFIQGDHFQMNMKRYTADREQETEGIRALIQEAVSA